MSDESMPNAMRPIYTAVVALTDAVCAAHLNDAYASLGRRMALALCRKMPSPLAGGAAAAWAAGILFALGQTNLLFNAVGTPHMTADALAAACGVSKSDAAARAARIREALGMRLLDHRWMLEPPGEARARRTPPPRSRR